MAAGQAVLATPAQPAAGEVRPQVGRVDLTPLELRRALGRFATGVTVVTTLGPEGKPLGLTANSFTSVSMDPPLVLWCLASRSHNLAAFRDAPGFAINVLSNKQIDLCRQFSDPKNPDRFAGVAWRSGEVGMPLLSEALVSMSCAPWAMHEAGDHVIFMGRITALEVSGGEPLVFSAGKLGGFQAAA